MADIYDIHPEDYPDMQTYRQAMLDALKEAKNPLADMLIVDLEEEVTHE